MKSLTFLIVLQSVIQSQQAPVLEFPEPGLDDPAAYEGYSTRFFRDSHDNAFQIYIDSRSGRVVHVWADAVNESAAFTVRDTTGRAAPLNWGSTGAVADSNGGVRIMRHRLTTNSDAVEVGWFLLGTMRQERDFQYQEWHRRPFGSDPFVLPELSAMIESIETLPDSEREHHLGLLHAREPSELTARLTPRISLASDDSQWIARVAETSFDGANHMTLVFRGDAGSSSAYLENDVLHVRSVTGEQIRLDVTITTDSPPLTPLGRDEIFNEAFTTFYARQRETADSLLGALSQREAANDVRVLTFRRLQREVRGLELLSYEEKLLASMPNYATYFGRDMMMTALMFEPIVSVDVQEDVIGSVLRKVSVTGDVSHEEALGGQAIRENAAEYTTLVREWREASGTDPSAAADYLAEARQLLGDLQSIRENYRMVDDDFQLPVLVARYLSRSDVPASRKRRFLNENTPSGATRLESLARNLVRVTTLSHSYVLRPAADNLVGFQYRDDRGWLPGSWRDSRAGYGGGRFAMDVNVVWIPNALQGIYSIVRSLDALGFSWAAVLSHVGMDSSVLESYVRDTNSLQTAIETWLGARRHFQVVLDPREIVTRVTASSNSWEPAERTYWLHKVEPSQRPLSFLAVSLDSVGAPVPVLNTDVAMDLFLSNDTEQILRGSKDPSIVLRELDGLVRPYPVGLFVEGLGPLVANDVYANQSVQRAFRDDAYHSPRVVWGREVNLLLLGLAKQIGAAYGPAGNLRSDDPSFHSYVVTLQQILEMQRAAVEASGLRHGELWSYRIDGDTLRPMRYGTSSDIQLWSLTDLAVRFLLGKLPVQ